MTKLTYPDGSAVNYTYDANHNLLTVTDWANRVTSYTYDENNRVIGVTKPDGSVTTTVYDNMQRVTSTVERTADGAVITGFEYTYDDLSRITEEKVLANSTKFCYTYDDLGRVTERRKETLGGVLISSEVFSHDAAGNVTSACGSCVQYDTNNRLTVFDGNPVYYDRDGNMLDNGVCCFDYDSANRLVRVCDHEYTYNAEDVRIRKLCDTEDTLYTYNTNAKLTQLLTKTTCCTETKYVYGIGLIGEEVNNSFKTYHFDFRGSTVAITDASGNITDTFAYDTYGKLIGRTGTSDIIFKYNGRDGVITDGNGLIYMRARYYSPDMRRFVNADVVAGSISNAVTLNRFAYANGNPVSFVDPFGLSVERLANQRVFDGLRGVYDIAFEFYSNERSSKKRIELANEATIKYLMKGYYKTGFAKKIAWELASGNLPDDVIKRIDSVEQYRYIGDSPAFYGTDDGEAIDIVHMFATLSAYMYTGVISDEYTGWAGDLITLAGDLNNERKKDSKLDCQQFVYDSLDGLRNTKFSRGDLIGDIDALLISKKIDGRPIYEVVEEYYSSDANKRFSSFYKVQAGGHRNVLVQQAERYLYGDLRTIPFKAMFNAEYSKKLAKDVAAYFANYIEQESEKENN